MSFDVAIIGGGTNGLAAGALLAKRGHKVVLLEQRPTLGGLAAGYDITPGYKTAGFFNEASTVWPEIIDTLGLPRFGLQFAHESPRFFIPDLAQNSAGKGILIQTGSESSAEEIAPYSSKDAAQFKNYTGFLKRTRGFVNDLMTQKPLSLEMLQTPDLYSGVKTAVKLRTLGRKDMFELLRAAPMCVADWLNEYYETDLLKSGLASPALWSSFCGPWSPSTTTNLLLWEAASRVTIPSGPAGVAHALAQAAIEAGVDCRTGSEVSEILFHKADAAGVRLKSGEEIRAEVVLSVCDPKTTFLKLVPVSQMTDTLEKRVRVIRSRGTTAKIDLALKGDLRFKCRPDLRTEYARTGRTLDDMERAFDAVKYGEISQRPVLDIYVPTVSNPDLAPKGCDVVSVLVHFAPYTLRQGWSDQAKSTLLNRTLDELENYAPGTRAQVAGSKVFSPLDIETQYGTTEGHLFHGEHALDQLVMTRPTPECAQYDTPLRNLFLGGSGSHPGGGLTCGPGILSAQTIDRYLKS